MRSGSTPHRSLASPTLAAEARGGEREIGMNKSIAVIAIAVSSVVVAITPASAAGSAYQNCNAMHVRYKGGVGKPGAVDRRASGHAKYAPTRSTALYNANKGLDRDRDGIACEQ